MGGWVFKMLRANEKFSLKPGQLSSFGLSLVTPTAKSRAKGQPF
jgi:hypothetical protein